MDRVTNNAPLKIGLQNSTIMVLTIKERYFSDIVNTKTEKFTTGSHKCKKRHKFRVRKSEWV